MSGLITPDEFILSKEFIKALKDIDKGLQDVLKTIGTASNTIKKYNDEVKNGADNQKKLSDNQKKANETTTIAGDIEKEVTKIQQKRYNLLVQQSEAVQKETQKLKEETEAIKKQTEADKASQNTRAGLIAQNKILQKQKNDLVITDKDYKQKVAALNAEIEKNQKIIDSTNTSEQNRLKGIGKYKEGIVKAYAAIQGAIILAKGAFNLFIDTVNSTGSTADAFAATLEGWKQGFNSIKIAVATADFKDFTKKVKDAISEGRRYAEGLDEVDDKMRALKISEAEAANEILKQRKIQNSALSTDKEKIAAGKEILKLEEQLQTIRVGIAQQAYDNEITNIASIANGTKNVSDEMRKEIELYVKRDANIIKTVENGAKYKKNLEELNKLQAQNRINAKTGITDDVTINRINELQTENNKLYSDYLTYLRLTLPTDEKYNLLTEKKVELEQAKGSAMENTLRIQSKLDTALNKSNETTEEKGEDLNQKGEQWLNKYLARENEKREQTEKFNQYVLTQEQIKAEKIEKTEQQITDDIIAQKEREKAAYELAEEQKRQAIEQTRDLQIALVNELFNVGQAFGDAEIANLEARKEREIAAAGNNAKKKERIEEQYAKKIAEIKRKQAVADKIQGIFNVGINTAQAIMKFLADPGGYAGAALSAWAAALGLVQIAAIEAKPIPKFFKGVKDLKEDTLAWVGEKGTELGETKKGEFFLTPEKATLMPLKAGDTIHTHEETIKMMGGMTPESVDKMVSEQRLMRKELKNIRINTTNITKDGWFATHNGINNSNAWRKKYIGF